MELNCKTDFPLLNHYSDLVYLDSAATTQKPNIVLEAMNHYYATMNANIHRGVYRLSEQATEAYESARLTVKDFINAASAKECIFVKSATEAINLVASGFADTLIKSKDEIIVTQMEHHSNLVPWQMICQKKGSILKVIPLTPEGDLDLSKLDDLFSTKTKLLAINHLSNAMGSLNPIETIIEIAHKHQVPVLVDATQSIPRLSIDCQKLDCDFLVFSSHKTYGPTGLGVLYGKQSWLERLPPYQGGGDMVLSVSFERTVYQDLPNKFEAGTPPIAEAIGLATALQYLKKIGLSNIEKHEEYLTQLALNELSELPYVKLIGCPTKQLGIISFTMDKVHPHDIGTILSQENIAIRTGHHCAMPLMEHFQVPATARASFGIYSTVEDIHHLIYALKSVHEIFN